MSQGQLLLSYLQGNPSPNIEDAIHCSDVVQIFKTGNQQLLQILITSDGMNKLIKLIQTSTNFQIVRRILQMFTMQNSPLLSELINSNEYTENLILGLDDVSKNHPYVTGAITQILFSALDVYPGDFYEVINTSNRVFPILIKNVEVNSVYYLCTRIVIASTEAQTFCWYLFVSLMGDHGTGCAVPKSLAYEPASSTEPYRLTPGMRKKVLELLFSFFNEFPDTCDFYNDISIALPLILQDAFDDSERALIFKLGLLMNINEAMAYAAQSVLNCMKSSDLLLQFAMYYIQSFGIIISNSSVELILYRMLHRQPNNFLLIILAKMIQSIITGSNSDKSDLTESLQMILADAFKNSDISSVLMRAFRMYLCCSSEGVSIDPESNEANEQLRRFSSDPYIMEIDADYIQQLKRKADTISASNSFTPTFSVSKLWEHDYKKMEEKFKNIGSRPLQISTTNEEQRPQPQEQPVPKKQPFSLPKQVAQQTSVNIGAPNIQEEEDNYSSDNYYEEESTDESEELKMREMIERQKAAKAQAEKSKEVEENEIIDSPIKESVQKSPAILNLPQIPPVPKAAEITPSTAAAQSTASTSSSNTTTTTTSKGKGKKGKVPKKTKGKAKAKKSSKATQKPKLSFTMNIGVVDAPPDKPPVQHLELNISTLKLKPRKPKPALDRKILVIDCPLRKQDLSINVTNEFEVKLDEMLNYMPIQSPHKILSKEEIRKLVDSKISDSEEDFDIEPLPSEMEEDNEDDDSPRNYIANPFATTSKQNLVIDQEEEEFFEEEEEEEEEEITDSEQDAQNGEKTNIVSPETPQQQPVIIQAKPADQSQQQSSKT